MTKGAVLMLLIREIPLNSRHVESETSAGLQLLSRISFGQEGRRI